MEFNNFSNLLIITGIALLTIGLLWNLSNKFLPLGKLPGDIKIEKEKFKFYFPLGSSILISIILSLLLIIINYLRT